MKLGFISDLHLSENMPSVTEGFFNFLKNASHELSHLYILGDLFEAWIGDDDNSKLATNVMQSINNASQNGLEVFFIHGNRDLLCGQDFAKKSNLKILPDPFFMNFFDLKIALSHGDDFCTNDLKYIEFKKEVRSKQWQDKFLEKSLDERLKIASNMRDVSEASNNDKDINIMDVTSKAIDQFFEEHHIDLLIHGHTHRPFIHHIDSNSIGAVLGSWEDKGWVIEYEQELTLRSFPI